MWRRQGRYFSRNNWSLGPDMESQFGAEDQLAGYSRGLGLDYRLGLQREWRK